MSDAYFFGYGSLVNRATHAHAPNFPARLRGWRRVWKSTRLRELAFLSAEPWEGSVLDGLVAHVPGADWAALDLREQAYGRHDVSALCEHAAGPVRVEVYAVAPQHAAGPGVAHPVLLSYVDTVVQGFAEVFGEAGALRFFETTAGWPRVVVDDRAAPVYPRATVVSAELRATVDEGLRRLGVAAVKG